MGLSREQVVGVLTTEAGVGINRRQASGSRGEVLCTPCSRRSYDGGRGLESTAGGRVRVGGKVLCTP